MMDLIWIYDVILFTKHLAKLYPLRISYLISYTNKRNMTKINVLVNQF